MATICGCGEQGWSQLRALSRIRELETVFAFDALRDRREGYAKEMSSELGLDVRPTDDLPNATFRSDIIVTCTTSDRFIIHRRQVSPGAFVAGVGADNPHKQELDPALLAASTVVTDILEQCATIGDLHHAIDAGLMSRADVYAELGEIVASRKVGRRTADEIIVFDSTGTALQDVAAAALVYEKALAEGHGHASRAGNPSTVRSSVTSRPSLGDLTRYFLRLGALGFGGPIALVGYMHRDLVEGRGWVTEDEYREGLALAQLSPGPLAAQLCFYLGYIRAGSPAPGSPASPSCCRAS